MSTATFHGLTYSALRKRAGTSKETAIIGVMRRLRAPRMACGGGGPAAAHAEFVELKRRLKEVKAVELAERRRRHDEESALFAPACVTSAAEFAQAAAAHEAKLRAHEDDIAEIKRRMAFERRRWKEFAAANGDFAPAK